MFGARCSPAERVCYTPPMRTFLLVLVAACRQDTEIVKSDPEEVETCGALNWWADVDGDGYGDVATTESACEAPEGFVNNRDDCDDGDAAVNPDAEEVC